MQINHGKKLSVFETKNIIKMEIVNPNPKNYHTHKIRLSGFTDNN